MINNNLKNLILIIQLIYKTEGFFGIKKRLFRIFRGEYIEPTKFHNIIGIEFINKINKISKKFGILRNYFIKLKLYSLLVLFFNNIFNGFIFRRNINHCLYHLDSKNILIRSFFSNCIFINGWIIDFEINQPASFEILLNNEAVTYKKIFREDLKRVNWGRSVPDGKLGFSCVLSLKKGINIVEIIINKNNKKISLFKLLLVHFVNKKLKVKGRKLVSYKEVTKFRRRIINDCHTNSLNHISMMIHKPFFEILIIGSDEKFLTMTLNSLKLQWYKNFKVSILDEHLRNNYKDFIFSKSNNPEYLIYITCGNTLYENALYEFANTINFCNNTDLIYGDEELIRDGEVMPFYKPAWSPDYLETFNYLGSVVCYKKNILDNQDFSNQYDYNLRFTEITQNVVHIPIVLGTTNLPQLTASENIYSLNGRLIRTGRIGYAVEDKEYAGCYHSIVKIDAQKKVSIVIPTAGHLSVHNNRIIDLICNLVGQLKDKTNFKNIEIIVVHGGELTTNQLDYLAAMNCISVIHSNIHFSFSNSCNLGASKASGEFLLFLNDDIEVESSDWIEQILMHFEKPHVGIVGVKLKYPDGTLQHAGVVHNYGCPDHVRDGFLSNESGYFYSTCGARNYMAVTGACLTIRKSLFVQVGGFTEELPINFNDTDLCLKVLECNRTVVYAPTAILIHMTSQSRAAYSSDIISANQAELSWYQLRWAKETAIDPYYNQRYLDLARPTFTPTYNSDVI